MFHATGFDQAKPLDPEIHQPFDLLAGAERVEGVVESMAAIRQRFSNVELGTLAGIAVLDQYRVALAEISIRWWKDRELVLAGVYAVIALALPLLGFFAGLAIDVAIFGGAAEALIKVSPIYAAFAAGSLVFAVGLGIAPPEYKRVLGAAMAVACLGASLIAADNPQFRAHFANALPWLKSEEQARERDLFQLRRQVQGIDRALANKEAQVNPPGRRPLLDDGTVDNDDAARQLYVDIDRLNTERIAAEKAVGDMEAKLAQATRDNGAQYLGRAAGAFYIFCWLYASQIVIAMVIAMSAGKLEAQKRRSADYEFKRSFVRQLDGGNSARSRALVAAAVLDLLVRRFNPILTQAGAGDSEKLERFTDMFVDEPLEDMCDVGTNLVCTTLIQRRGNMLVRPRGLK